MKKTSPVVIAFGAVNGWPIRRPVFGGFIGSGMRLKGVGGDAPESK
jgi:hypothetical protein